MDTRTGAILLFAIVTHTIAAAGGYMLGRGVGFAAVTDDVEAAPVQTSPVEASCVEAPADRAPPGAVYNAHDATRQIEALREQLRRAETLTPSTDPSGHPLRNTRANTVRELGHGASQLRKLLLVYASHRDCLVPDVPGVTSSWRRGLTLGLATPTAPD